MKRFLVSPEARADLDGIWEGVAERSSIETASSFLWKIHDLFRSIALSPAAGLLVPGLEDERVRKFPMGNFLFYYRVVRGTVTIWRVLHGKRLQMRLLRNRGRRRT